ncbi:hypothetical protein [Kribbella deserti]|uniref:HEAT repeat domain-containing protein n=1 Tax=Kribbella deserti TaxID=1926257 RepID=A0ABV6QP24_9ACTN
MTEPEVLRLPAVRLPAESDLAPLALASLRLTELKRLAEWGQGRSVNNDGELDPHDVEAGTKELGLGLDELLVGWAAAVDAELLTLKSDQAVAGPALAVLEQGTDQDKLDVWADIVDWDIETAYPADEPSEALPVLLMMLHLEPVVSFEDLVGTAVEMDGTGEDAADAVSYLMSRLLDLGVVLTDGELFQSTPLGQFGLSCWFGSVGVDAPVITDLAEASPVQVMEMAQVFEDDGEREAFVHEWIDAVGPSAAADELVTLASTGTPDDRSGAFALLQRVGAAAEDAVRSKLDDPSVRPHAINWLTEAGLSAPELTPAESSWLFADMLVAVLGPDDETQREAAAELGFEDPRSLDHIAGLADTTHPAAAEVLQALATHHPDPAVVKAARKATLQSRSV